MKNSIAQKTRRISSIFASVVVVTLIFGIQDLSAAQDQTASGRGQNSVAKEHIASTPQVQNLQWTQGSWEWMEQLKQVHPLVIAAAQVLLVTGVCICLTDNKELELYLKIDFKPPKTDILN